MYYFLYYYPQNLHKVYHAYKPIDIYFIYKDDTLLVADGAMNTHP